MPSTMSSVATSFSTSTRTTATWSTVTPLGYRRATAGVPARRGRLIERCTTTARVLAEVQTINTMSRPAPSPSLPPGVGDVSEEGPLFRVVDVSGAAPVRIVVAGELDLLTAAELQAALAAIDDDDIVIDCRDLTFLDSTGIGILAAHHQRLAAKDHRLKLVGLDGAPRRALQILGILNDLT